MTGALPAPLAIALRADHGDWDTWQVLGDWLVERGDPRGLLIGIEVAMARGVDDAATFADLHRSRVDLLATHHAEWAPDIPAGISPTWFGGFMVEIGVVSPRSVPMRTRMAQVDALLEHPLCQLIGAVHWRRVPIDAATLAMWPLLTRLGQVSGVTASEDASLVALARSPHAARLRRLSIASPLTQATLHALSHTESLRHLHDLHIVARPDSESGEALARALQKTTLPHFRSEVTAAALARALRLTSLRKLGVAGMPLVGPDDADEPTLENVREVRIRHPTSDLAWLTHPVARGLRTLRGAVDAGRVCHLLEAPALQHLEQLGLGGPGVTPDAVDAIVASPMASTLRQLTLEAPRARDATPLGPAAVTRLSRGRFPKLVCLRLAGQRVDDHASVALAQATGWPSLELVDLRTNEIGDAGFAAWRDAAHPKLRALDLGRNRIGAEGCRAWADHDGPQELGWLSLADNRLGGDGVKALCRARLPKLQSLSLRRTHLGPEGMAAVATATGFSLVALDVGNHPHLQHGVRALARPDASQTLRYLGIYNVGCAVDELRGLLQHPSFRQLDVLFVGNGKPELLHAVMDRGAQIRTLSLRSTRLRAEEADQLATTLRLPHLGQLDLSNVTVQRRSSAVRFVTEPLGPPIWDLDTTSIREGNGTHVAIHSVLSHARGRRSGDAFWGPSFGRWSPFAAWPGTGWVPHH